MLSVSLYPNNEIRLRLGTKVPSRSRDPQYRPPSKPKPLPYSLPTDYYSSLGLDVSPESDGSYCYPSPSVGGADTHPARSAGASLSLDSNFKTGLTGKGGWGVATLRRTSFTLASRRRILRAGGALDKIGLVGKTAFFTGTLPGSTPEAIATFAAWTGYASNRVTQWFRDYSCPYWAYCWEWQKRGALHLHAFVVVEDPVLLDRLIYQFKAFWLKILSDITAKSGVDLFAREKGGSWSRFSDLHIFRSRGERVRKSIAAYLAKYLSKSSSINTSSSSFPYPSRWSGMSRGLSALVRELSFSCSVSLSPEHEAQILSDLTSHLSDFAVKSYFYTDKYRPSNRNFIYYVPPELWGTDGYCDFAYLFDLLKIPHCLLAARLTSAASAASAIRLALRDGEFFIATMVDYYPNLPYLFEVYSRDPSSLLPYELEEFKNSCLDYLAEISS